MLDIEDSLRRSFEPIKHEYKTKKAAYDSAESVKVIQEFAALGSPSAEANYSIRMFMDKYFLDDHGKPDKSKTPDPLPLPGFSQRSQMHAAAEAIPGLETQSGGGSHNDDRVIVVGWDRSAVWRVAGSIVSQGAVRRAAAAKAELEDLMKRHEDFAKRASTDDRNVSFSMSAILGLYLVECDDMSEPNNMRLKVTEGREGLVGIFDFDVLKGIMLLGQSREEVATRVSNKDIQKYSDSSNEQEEVSEDEKPPEFANAKKRKASTASRKSAPNKRHKPKDSKANRIYLQWRGMETGESEIQLDPGNEHQGHLDFLDDLGTRFVGTADFGFVGRNVQFKGYKIGSAGGPVTRSWNDYSEAEHEKARTGRWG